MIFETKIQKNLTNKNIILNIQEDIISFIEWDLVLLSTITVGFVTNIFEGKEINRNNGDNDESNNLYSFAIYIRK